MVRIIGHTDRGVIHTTTTTPGIHFSVSEFHSSLDKKSTTRTDKRFDLGPCLKDSDRIIDSVEVSHVSIQPLTKQTFCDEYSSKYKSPGHEFLVALSYKLPCDRSSTTTNGHKYSATLLMIRTADDESSEVKVLDNVEIAKGKESEVRVHFLPRCAKIRQLGEETEVDSTEDADFSCTSRVIVLILEESIVIYDIESSIFSENEKSPKLEVLSSELLAKNFWWAQWFPHQEALAFAHFRKLRQSSFFEDGDFSAQELKPFMSVLQFHKDFPRESVLNMPLLDVYTKSEHSERLSQSIKLSPDPNVLSSASFQLKLLVHPSGVVFLFHVCPNTFLKYSVNMLHHNQTLDVDVKLKTIEAYDNVQEIKLDVGLYCKDQYLMVVGWPKFVHFLDIGSIHEPSHHLILDWHTLGIHRQSPFLCLFNPRTDNEKNVSFDEKTDLSPKFATTTKMVFQDLSHTNVELSSSLLLPLMEERKTDVQFKLAVLHHFLVHLGDINVSKRIIYDEGKKRGNLFLKQVYQEFLIGHAHLQTKKQILPNMDSFLHLIPYSADPEANTTVNTTSLTIKIQDSKRTDVSIMLLSPSQRIFPHNVSDLWTSLWYLNRNYSRSKRFKHKEISEKLILSLQCYKPEALSRASTPGPMSPSSPMICTSLGDIVGMFGRRATELQLPFVEHESCTANKQEYIFSINLREMSMHLLKERKEWPLHGHTVAGKYVCALGDTARLLCHLICLTVHLQPTKNRDKGFNLIDTLDWDVKLNLFMLMEHYTLALSTLACALPQGFTPFFAYLGYRVLKFDQFLWHVRAGTFDLQIDIVKIIMGDIKEDKDENVRKKLQLLSLMPKTRANRILNTWPHKMSVCLRARQHASDLISGSVSQNRKRMTVAGEKKKKGDISVARGKMNPLDTFFQLLTAKANPSEIDLGLLTEATLISMEGMSNAQ